MGMSAAEICSEVYGLSGFGRAEAYQNGDIDDQLIFFLLRRVARDIAKYRWQELVKTGRITITSGETVYNLPNDFREFIPSSVRTEEDLRPIDFPSNFETWAQIDAKVGITGVQHRLRLQGGSLVTLPSDTETYTIRFEYISNFPVEGYTYATINGELVQSKSPKEKLLFERDEDEWLLDDDLIIKGLKAKWSLEKGLDTLQADAADYQAYLNELRGTQAHSQRIMMGGKSPYMPQPPYTNLWK
jgi:hypothetical protein